MTAIFIVTTIICAVGWAFHRLALISVCHYIKEECTLPTDEQLKECNRFALTHFFKKGQKIELL